MKASASDVRLAATYDALWADGRQALATGRLQVEPLPAPGSPRWGISAVLRPRPWPAALTACAAACATLIGSNGVLYDEGNLHITLRAIEGHRHDIRRDDEDVAAYRDVLASLVRDAAPLRLRLRGLAATPGGVLVQGWPSGDLAAFRRTLYDRLDERGLAARGPERSPDTLRTTAHATLAIFEGPVARPLDLVDLVDAWRATDFGEWHFAELSLVGYRRTAGRVGLIEHDRFAFGLTCEARP